MAKSLARKSEGVFKKLTRLFRHGPSIQVRAKYDREFKNKGVRSSSAYLRNNLTYNSYMNFGSFDRLTRYSDFANMEYFPEINASLDIYLPHYMEAGTTSETTFKLRVGSASAYLITMNGASSSRKFGGVCVSGITIKEIKV